MWKMDKEGFLFDKIGHWQYKDKLLILPRVGVPGFIEEVETGHVLSVKNGASDVHLTPKITVTTKITRSTLKSAPKSDLRDLQKWVVCQADSQGWFRITHAKSGKYLTSSDIDSVTVETLKETKKNKKNLVKVQKTYVWCHKLEEFICHVAHERGYEDENLKIEIGLDSGGDLLKLMMTVDEYDKSKETVSLGEGEFCPPPKKRRKKGKYMNKYKPRGVKGVFLIGVVKHCPETYKNFELILKDVGILNFAFVPDFKAKRICLGLQPCSATHSCSFCKGKAPFIKKAELRTFKSLNDNFEGYQALVDQIGAKKAKKFARDFFSVTNKSLIKGDFETQRILFKVLIDELHVYLGVMNKLFDSLYKVMIEDITKSKVFHKSVYDWGYDHHIVGQNYHGGALDGPNIEKLLENLDSLAEFVDPKFHDYIECMRHFKLVAEACFGAEKLYDNYKDRIDDFEKSYRGLGISITPKVHVVFYEVKIFCDETGKPLGMFSAQPFESCHFDFNPTYKCYKRPENHPQHGPKLKDATVSYNGAHVLLTKKQ